MTLTLRQLRLRAVWLLVLPFLWFSTPTPTLLVVGAALAALGLALRAWSAGTIRKDEGLATTGPYAYTRNPLYLGSSFVGLGVSIAGGHWVWPVLFLAFFAWVYGRTMEWESRHLQALFPAQYAEYARAVPAFVPRRTAWRPAPGSAERPRGDAADFVWSQYLRNREWEALLGAISAFLLLAGKIVVS